MPFFHLYQLIPRRCVIKFLLIDSDTELLGVVKTIEDVYDYIEIVVALTIRSCLKFLFSERYSLVLIKLSSDDKSIYYLLPPISKTTPIPIYIVSQFSVKELVKTYISGADFCRSEPQNLNTLEAFLNAQYRRIAHLSHIEYDLNDPMIIYKDLINISTKANSTKTRKRDCFISQRV